MELLESVRSDCVLARAEIEDKDGVLAKIAEMAADSPPLSNVGQEDILQALREREDLDSTGYGDGIAIPHCRLSGVEEFVVGLVTLKEPIGFDAIDGEPVDFLAFIIAPDTPSNAHIRILSQISRVLQIPKAVKEMRVVASSELLRESFLRWAGGEPDSEASDSNLFHVFIQEEDLFQDILKILSSIESSAAFVIEMENTSAYLGKLPLFAGFWSDNPDRFGRMIIALVSDKMTNETIRRIEQRTGKLSENPGIMVTVQKPFYCDGFPNQ